MLQPAFYFHALFKDADEDSDHVLVKYTGFWEWTIFPISLGAMAVSFVLKVSKLQSTR
jgi:hypothetical protein